MPTPAVLLRGLIVLVLQMRAAFAVGAGMRVRGPVSPR